MMLSRWRPAHLLLAWGGYWAGLLGVTLGPAVLAATRLSGPGQHGSVSAGFGDGAFTLSIVNAGRTMWTGSVGMWTAALWLAGPPLLLWVAWLLARPRRDESKVVGSSDSAMLPPTRVATPLPSARDRAGRTRE